MTASDVTPSNPRDLETIVVDAIEEVTGKRISDKSADLTTYHIDSMKKLDILATLEQRLDIQLIESSVSEFVSIERIVRVAEDAIRNAEAE